MKANVRAPVPDCYARDGVLGFFVGGFPDKPGGRWICAARAATLKKRLKKRLGEGHPEGWPWTA